MCADTRTGVAECQLGEVAAVPVERCCRASSLLVDGSAACAGSWEDLDSHSQKQSEQENVQVDLLILPHSLSLHC